MTLKTLKDLEVDFVDTEWMSGEATASKEVVTIDDLKQEAIKHTKYINAKWANKGNHITPEQISIMNNQHAVIEWIKNFFNIK